MASSKIPTPSYTTGQNYELFKKEINIWEKITSIEKDKQGLHVLLNLPGKDRDPHGIKDKLLEVCDIDDLGKDDGLKSLLATMDKYLGKDDLEDAWDRFQCFEDCKKSPSESWFDYITNFDNNYERIKSKGITLPASILAFKLLKGADLNDEERLIIMTGLDFTKKDELYNQAKKSLKKFKCGVGTASSAVNDFSSLNIKSEPTFYTSSGRGRSRGRANFHTASNSYRESDRFRTNVRGDQWASGRKPTAQNYKDINPVSKSGQYLRCHKCDSFRHLNFNCPAESTINPVNKENGQPMRCLCCDSVRHLMEKCPHTWESKGRKVHFVNESDDCDYELRHEEPEDDLAEYRVPVVLFTRDKQELQLLGQEAAASGVLDSGCASTVCGKRWLDMFLDQLPDSKKSQVVWKDSNTLFQFGGEYSLKSIGKVVLPGEILGMPVLIETDVVDSDIPLLFSNKALKAMKATINYVTDEASLMGQNTVLNKTSAGHHCVSLLPNVDIASVNAVVIQELGHEDKLKTITKLHQQYGHPGRRNFVAHLKAAEVWSDEYSAIVDNIYKTCEICKIYAPANPRPVVALPMASHFNQYVAMDLKHWREGLWILHIIDMFSRYTCSVFVTRKRPQDIIEAVIKDWISVFGVIENLLTDNGGEFNNEELREITSLLNLKSINTTGAESPFQNGLCERVHAVTDMILCKLHAQYPKTPLNVLLKWAVMAKNSLQMWAGFSAHQLVFGVNPNLPNVLTAKVPALESGQQSAIYARHVAALHSAREEFIKSEACEKIKRALKHNIRLSTQNFKTGDRVYYRKEGKNTWQGPASVIGQEGKVVFVKHGGYLLRASPSRLMLVEELQTETGKSSEHLYVNMQDDSSHAVTSQKNGSYSTVKSEDASQSVEEVTSNSKENRRASSVSIESEGRVEERDREDRRASSASEGQVEERRPDAGAGFVDEPRRSLRCFNKETGSQIYNVSTTCPHEVFAVNIPKSQHDSAECLAAKADELSRLQQFFVYEEVPNNGQHCISTRWVIVQKGERVRARLTARGFEEDILSAVDSPTIGKNCVRMVLALAVSQKWTIKTTDVKSAFLQGQPLEREVFLKPPKESDTGEGYIWKLRRCLYGLNDAARQFYLSLAEELRRLGCNRSAMDPSLFYKCKDGKLEGVLVSHIDDFLHAGTPSFDAEVMKKICQRFSAGSLLDGTFVYTGYQIHQNENFEIIMDQDQYLRSAEPVKISPARQLQGQELLNDKELKTYRSMVGTLGWIVQGTRPELSFQLLDASTRNKSAKVTDLKLMSKVILNAKSVDGYICFPDLGDPLQWRLVVYADASHANLCEGTGSCGGHIIFLVGNNRSCPVSWKAAKLRRVCRSTAAAEGMSLGEAVENAILNRNLLCEILHIPRSSISVTAVTDHKGLRENICNALNPKVDDLSLRQEIAIIRQCLQYGEIDSVSLCPSTEQLADCLTKRGSSGQKLMAVLQAGSMPSSH